MIKSFKQFLMEEPPAWHGTPHHFDAFSLDKIGTGEGHQAFGWGLYFASSRKVAEYYRDVLFDDEYVKQVNARLSQLVKEMEPYRAFEYGKFKDPRGYELKAEYDRLMDERAQRSSNKALYHVEIIPGEDEMLDWHKTLDQQSDTARKALASAGIASIDKQKLRDFDDALLAALHDDGDPTLPEQPSNPTGEEIYKRVIRLKGSDKAASKYLHSIGVPGIKYLEGSFHGGGQGNYNYVIFDDKDVIIKEKL